MSGQSDIRLFKRELEIERLKTQRRRAARDTGEYSRLSALINGIEFERDRLAEVEADDAERAALANAQMGRDYRLAARERARAHFATKVAHAARLDALLDQVAMERTALMKAHDDGWRAAEQALEAVRSVDGGWTIRDAIFGRLNLNNLLPQGYLKDPTGPTVAQAAANTTTSILNELNRGIDDAGNRRDA